MAMKNKAADSRLMVHPKGVNQGAQLCVLAVRHRPTMLSQQRLDLNALVYAVRHYHLERALDRPCTYY